LSSDGSNRPRPDLSHDGQTCEIDRLHRRIEQLNRAVEEQRLLALSRRAKVQMLREQLVHAQTPLSAIRSSPLYRLMVKLGRWAWLEPMMGRALATSSTVPAAGPAERSSPCVAVDMTPVLPGGENGGAKLVAIGLVRQLAELAPDWRFILLTSGKSHDELAYLDRPNVSRMCVIFQDQSASLTRTGWWPKLKMKVGRQLVGRLSPAAFDRLRRLDTRLTHAVTGTTLLRRIGANLYFCVFTSPNFYDPSVPVVSTVYDLQYKRYPLFFSPRELYYRDQHFMHTARVAARLVCISEYVRQTVVRQVEDPTRVLTSYIRLWKRIEKPDARAAREVRGRLKLTAGDYLFYPANFWPHKNHAMLLTAFALYRSRHPESRMKLVFTGAPVGRMAYLQERAAGRLGLSEHVVFAGFLPDEEFAGLLEGCRAVIFPSLYEGFGMPVMEAMAFGKPVACGNVTSLPEVADGAALLFDPRRPMEIAEAIQRIAHDDELVERLTAEGFRRVREFGKDGQMAREYLEIFKQVLGSRGPFINHVDGLQPDGWTTDRLSVTYAAGDEGRVLEMDMVIPRVPAEHMTVRYCHNDVRNWDEIVLEPESGVTFRQSLGAAGGFIDMEIGPLYRPCDIDPTADARELGFMCQRCEIVHPDGRREPVLIGMSDEEPEEMIEDQIAAGISG
jgi:glycosyltransferase involved in cell wall biosynthesis